MALYQWPPERMPWATHDGDIHYGRVSMTLALGMLLYLLGHAVYSLQFHPLAGYPGPALAACSRLPWWVHAIRGDQISWMSELHTKYGSVVRFSPNDLSYVDHGGEAWKAVHSRAPGTHEFPKAKEWFVNSSNGVRGMNNYLEAGQHRRLRRIFSPAFSDRALKAQEPLFRKHADMLVSKLREGARAGEPLNMVDMFQFTTFDIMGDLTFGQPLGLLEDGKYSAWVQHVFDSIRFIPIGQLIQHYPVLDFLATHFEPKFVTDIKYNHFKHSADRVDLRLKEGSAKPDIWNLVLSTGEEDKLTLEEMHVNSEAFMLAGSETTGTAMSGLVYLLLTNPEKLELLVREIRGGFASSHDITFDTVAGLKYLNACIHEGMRIYPSVPAGVPRAVHAAGQNIVGKWVAGGTRVSVHHWSTYHSGENFHSPELFAPERWLGSDEAYEADRRESVQPFGYGSRDCVGQNMAMHEMRLILSKTLFDFDLTLRNPLDVWTDQKAFILWEKKPLLCWVAEAAKG